MDKIADQLPNWKADLMTRAGRRVQVQHVLTSMTVYLWQWISHSGDWMLLIKLEEVFYGEAAKKLGVVIVLLPGEKSAAPKAWRAWYF